MAELTTIEWAKVAAIGLRHLQAQVAAFQTARSAGECGPAVHLALEEAQAALARAEAVAKRVSAGAGCPVAVMALGDTAQPQ